MVQHSGENLKQKKNFWRLELIYESPQIDFINALAFLSAKHVIKTKQNPTSNRRYRAILSYDVLIFVWVELLESRVRIKSENSRKACKSDKNWLCQPSTIWPEFHFIWIIKSDNSAWSFEGFCWISQNFILVIKTCEGQKINIFMFLTQFCQKRTCDKIAQSPRNLHWLCGITTNNSIKSCQK